MTRSKKRIPSKKMRKYDDMCLGRCKLCKKTVFVREFDSAKSRYEFDITGFCVSCQQQTGR